MRKVLIIVLMIVSYAFTERCKSSIKENIGDSKITIEYRLEECFDKFSVYSISVKGCDIAKENREIIDGIEVDIDAFKPVVRVAGEFKVVTLRVNDRPLKDKLYQLVFHKDKLAKIIKVPFPEDLLDSIVIGFDRKKICDVMDYNEGGEAAQLNQIWESKDGIFSYIGSTKECQ